MTEEEEKKPMEGEMAEMPEMDKMSEMPDNTETSESSDTPPQDNELVELINRFAPESDTSTPEAINNSALAVLKSMVPIYDKLYDLAKTNPETAAVLNDWLDTGDLGKAIARNYDPEEIKALVEEIENDDYEEDRNVYSEKVKSYKDYEDQMSKNMAASQMGAQEFVDNRGLDETQIEAFKPFVDKFLKDCEDRNLTSANWEILYDAFTKKDEVAEAEENGKIIGRNEKIVAQKKTREDVKNLMPEASAATSVGMANQKKEDQFLNSLRKKAEEKQVLS